MTSGQETSLDLPEVLGFLWLQAGLNAPSSAELVAQFRQLSPAALAYLGDAVYELYVRSRYLLPPKRIQLYHNQVVAQVRAEAQAQHLQKLQPHLTPEEQAILKQGRNAAKRTKRVDPELYQQATSLETLLGYLYITDPQRLADLLSQLPLE
ncbi:ribonuclease III [Phormidium tenue FACHB-886]|nr:ribonuclease III [Phormidium tenue FACHB-886]